MTYGPAAVRELVEGSELSYPFSVRRLERKHALTSVQLDEEGNTAMLSELLAHGDFEWVESPSDLEEKVGSAIEEELAARESGLLARIKRAFVRR